MSALGANPNVRSGALHLPASPYVLEPAVLIVL